MIRSPLTSRVIAAFFLLGAALWIAPSSLNAASDGYTMPPLPAEPAVPAPLAAGSVTMGDPGTFPEVSMSFPIQSGPFQPNWTSIAANYPTTVPSWLRAAKFGMWVHYGPEAEPSAGDWSAQHMYQKGTTAYNNSVSLTGSTPAFAGYKDIVRMWNPVDYSPSYLANLYYNAGARFVLVQGVHHDQFDEWNSTYNPWNIMNFGAKRDTMAEWAASAKSLGMRFGVAFHHEYGWWFYQPAYLSDTSGPYAGVPYDAEALLGSSGTGTWWQNYDLSRLYLTNLQEYKGISNPGTGYYNPSQGIFSNHLAYANWYAYQWGLRIIDAIEQYDPDFIYTDGNSTQPFSGYATGTGYKCNAMERVIAHYYNEALVRRGMVDTMSFVKFHDASHGVTLTNGVATTSESGLPSGIITTQPWVAEMSIGNWYYSSGIGYDDGTGMVHWILESVSRDGACVINLCPNPAGDLDSGAVTMLQGVGQWMTMNNAGIYGSRAWDVFEDSTGNFRFTVGADGYLYAYYMSVPAAGSQLTINSLGTLAGLMVGPITSVTMLGSTNSLVWSQTASGLNITCPSTMPTLPAGTAVGFRIGPPSSINSQYPSGLAAQPDIGQIDLSWSYPATVAPPATFNVERASSALGPYTTLATGLSGTTYTDTTAVPGTLYYYGIAPVTSTGTGSVCLPVSASTVGTPATTSTWLSEDVGAVGAVGSVSETNGTFTVNGSGTDIWYTADQFRYVFQAVNGDCTITARVINMQDTAPWAKAGVMIRDSLDPSSTDAIAYMSPSNGFALQQRTTYAASATGNTNYTGISVPYWVRLVRSGNTITAYRSSNGTTWTASGSTSISMSSGVYVGLAVSSVKNGTLCQAQFDNVSVTTGAYLPFDQTTGTTTPDAYGNGWAGTLVGGPTLVPGEVNDAVSLSGTGQYVTLPAGVAGGFTNFTIAAWVKMNSVADWMRIFDFGTGTNAYMFLTPANSGNGCLRFSITTGGSTQEQQINSSVTVATGTWTHIAVTLSGSLGTLYVNGTAVGTNSAMTLNPSSLGNTTNNYIGKSQFSGNPYLNALVDEFHIYSQALTAAQISSLMSGPAAPGGLAATPGNMQVTLTWNTASGATSYNVERATTSGGPYTTVAWYNTAANYTDTGLINGAPYYYVIVSANSPAMGGTSSEVNATPFGAPAAPPTGLAATSGNAQVALSWTAAAGASSYLVQRALTTNGAYAAIGTATSAGYTDTGLANGTTYYYVVSSLNGSGTSANYSSEVNATPSVPLSAAEAAPPAFLLSGAGANAVASLTVASSVPGHTYQLQYNPDLVNGVWRNLGSPIVGSGGSIQLNAPVNISTTPSCFYRILVQRE